MTSSATWVTADGSLPYYRRILCATQNEGPKERQVSLDTSDEPR